MSPTYVSTAFSFFLVPLQHFADKKKQLPICFKPVHISILIKLLEQICVTMENQTKEL